MDDVLQQLAKRAWSVREHAYVFGNTKVGCALITTSGEVFTGCNVEHRYRSHDVHAEVNAITTMIAGAPQQLQIKAIVIAANRAYFTPCGACMDWIMQFGTGETTVVFQSERGGSFYEFSAADLMPHYPR